MNAPRTCSRCGREIPRESPGGDCPACLMRAGFDTRIDDDKAIDPLDVVAIAARFPKLEIEGRVGRGGMGVVYRARQRALDRVVALKILHPDLAKREGFAERFEREARSLAMLDHPHIVRMLEAGCEDGLYYLMMEFVEGSDLRSVMNQGLPPQTALRLVQEISDALEYAHSKGVVHRDIKPENILVDRTYRAKIVDFGLAKLLAENELGPNLTQSRVVMGTPHYMAPEQMRGLADVDHRADIFSLGVVFYEMLTGALPVGHFPPPSKKVAVDVRLDEVVLRALENERELRYQRAGDMSSSVRSIEGQPHPTRQQAAATSPPIERSAIRSVLVLAIATLAMPFASFGIVWLLSDVSRATASLALRVAWYGALIVSLVLAIRAGRNLDRDPRLAGRGLARTALLVSITLLLLSLLTLVWERERSERLDPVRRELEQSMRIDPVYGPTIPDLAGVDERLRAMTVVRLELQAGLMALGLSEGEQYLEHYEPSARACIEMLEPDERTVRARRGDLGIPAAIAFGAIDANTVRSALESTLRLDSDDRGRCVVFLEGLEREYEFVRDEGRWLWTADPNYRVTNPNPPVDR